MDERFNVELIEEYIKSNHLTKIDFCRQCKISVSTLYKILHGKDFYVTSLFRIAKKMNLQMNEFFK